MSARYVSFDCYGTLIDWDAGLRSALGSPELVNRYHELEPRVQMEDPSRSYREVMTDVARRIGAGDPEAVPRSLPQWEPFPEVRTALERTRSAGWKLAILSNTDRDLIEASITGLGVPFELAIVASEVGSYKPALGHWRAFELETGRAPDVHVGASEYHDIAPAGQLGLKTVWVNRLGRPAVSAVTCEISDLEPLPEVLDLL